MLVRIVQIKQLCRVPIVIGALTLSGGVFHLVYFVLSKLPKAVISITEKTGHQQHAYISPC